jgi:hypothetical protein
LCMYVCVGGFVCQLGVLGADTGRCDGSPAASLDGELRHRDSVAGCDSGLGSYQGMLIALA